MIRMLTFAWNVESSRFDANGVAQMAQSVGFTTAQLEAGGGGDGGTARWHAFSLTVNSTDRCPV